VGFKTPRSQKQFNPVSAQGLAKIMHFQWNSDTFYSSRPQVLAFNGRDLILSGHIRRIRLQYHTSNKEIKVIFEDY
jgi:hypothetical protein